MRQISPPWTRRILTVAVLMAAMVWKAVPVLHAADRFEFSAGSTEIVLAEGRERTVLRGGARISSGSVSIRSAKIELYGNDFRFATAADGVVVLDTQRDFSLNARSFWFDRTTEDSRAEGDVVLDDRKNKLVVRGGYLEVREGGDLLIVQIAVRVFRDDLTARAQSLRYHREREVLELSGYPVVYWKGDEYRAARIIMNLATEEIEMLGDVSGRIVVERKEDVETQEPSSTTSGDGAAP